MRRSNVNQQRIADDLNLSRTTVSRCFTNHPGINPETRSRVFKLAASLGYTYLEGKTGKKSDRKALSRFGVLICTNPDSYADEVYENPGALLLSGVSEFAQLQKAQLDIHFVTPGESSLKSPSYEGIKELHDREWDGVLLIYPFPAPVINSLQKLFPVVSLVQQLVQSPLNCVDVNHQRGIEMVVGHLAKLGHERIGFLTNGYDLTAKWALCRYSAFLAETARIIRPPQPDDIIDPFTASKMSIAEINRYAAAQTRKGVTAWVCAADHQAYQLYSHLTQEGFTVPDDVSITGFDGIVPPTWAPPLTTLRIPYHQIGLTAGKRLHDLVMKRFDVAQVISIDCIFQPGETTQKP